MPFANTSIIHAIYDAALDSRLWPSVVSEITEFYDGSVGVLMSHDLASPENDIHVHVNNPEDIQQLYAEQYFLKGDIWYQIAKRNWPIESVIIGNDHINDSELRETGFYQDILKPADCGQQLSGSIEASGNLTKAIAISRPFSGRRFDAEDKYSMQELMAHMDRAFSIHSKLICVNQEKSLLSKFLSMTNIAAMICDEQGRSVFLNELAESMFTSNEGLQLIQNKIQGETSKDNDLINGFFKHIRTKGSGVLNLNRHSPLKPYQLIGFQIDGDKHALGGNAKMVGVFIGDPEHQRILDASLLESLYRLTKAEAGIAQLLFSGLSPEEIAAQKNIKISTVRTHLHRIFDKTETRTQAQLIRVIAEGVAWYRSPKVIN